MLRIYDQSYILSDLTFKSHCFFWSVSFNKYLFSLSLSLPLFLFFFLHDNHLMDLHATQELATNISFLSHANFSSLIWIVFQTPVIQWALNVPLIVVSHACWYYARRCLSSSSYSSSLFSSSSAFFSHIQGKSIREAALLGASLSSPGVGRHYMMPRCVVRWSHYQITLPDRSIPLGGALDPHQTSNSLDRNFTSVQFHRTTSHISLQAI